MDPPLKQLDQRAKEIYYCSIIVLFMTSIGLANNQQLRVRPPAQMLTLIGVGEILPLGVTASGFISHDHCWKHTDANGIERKIPSELIDVQGNSSVVQNLRVVNICDAGNYTVYNGQNSLHFQVCVVQLTVASSTAIGEGILSCDVTVGTKSALCHPTVKMSWYRHGIPLTSGSGGKFRVTHFSAGSKHQTLLTIDHPTIADKTNYECRADVSVLNIPKQFTSFIEFTPLLTEKELEVQRSPEALTDERSKSRSSSLKMFPPVYSLTAFIVTAAVFV